MGTVIGMAEMTKGKRTGRPRSSNRDDVSVKADRTVVGKARQIALRRRIPLAQLITEIISPTIEREYAKLLHELDEKS